MSIDYCRQNQKFYVQSRATKQNLLLLREHILSGDSAIIQCESWYNRYLLDMCEQYEYVVISFNCQNTDASMVQRQILQNYIIKGNDLLPKYSKLLFVCKNFDQADDKVRALMRFASEQGKIQVTTQNTQK